MSETTQDLWEFILEALRKSREKHTFRSPYRHTWSDSHLDLDTSELGFIP